MESICESTQNADKKRVLLRVPAARYEELCRKADEIGLTVNAMVLMLIELGLKK